MRAVAPSCNQAPELTGLRPTPAFRRNELLKWSHVDEIDLADPAGMALLARLDICWLHMSGKEQAKCLRDKHFTISISVPAVSGIVILAGGIVALRTPEGVLVADPLSAVTLSAVAARRLETVLRSRRNVMTLVHDTAGVTSQPGVPAKFSPQTVTVVAAASRLPHSAGMSGPALVQWCRGGATAWSLRAAPPLAVLAAHAASLAVVHGGVPVPAAFWSAPDSASRQDRIADSVAELANGLLGDDISDDLRRTVIDCCIAGPDSLASRIADVLGAIPACFHAGASQSPGEPPAAWRHGAALLHELGADHVMLGLRDVAHPHRAIAALRSTLSDVAAMLFLEAGTDARRATVALGSDAAEFLTRRAGPHGRIGVIIPSAATCPADLYAIAHGLTAGANATVVISAPCWGLCHQIASDFSEAGNAGWFGMGAGLDELDIVVATGSLPG